MASIALTKLFEVRHKGLAVRLKGLASMLPLARDLTIADVQERPNGKDWLPVARLAHGEAGAGAFSYREADEATFATLIAHIAKKAADSPIICDPNAIAVFSLARRLAATDVPVLVTGPTGAGKEILARFVHRHSSRGAGAFVAVNCAAIPETMLEALLFGHQKGAFTGASSGGTGLFREADGGTLLLDEIAEMPLALQAKLLRALQEGEVMPVGATRPVKVDVRIVACANRDLPSEVAAGRFREDLYYRLNVFPLHLPPLRERHGDIAPLACGMLLRHGGGPLHFTRDALEKLEAHSWPGNVRELENVVRRALILAAEGETIGPDAILFDAPVKDAEASGDSLMVETPHELSKIVQLSEARAVFAALDECQGKRVAAASRLGISERTLRYRLASYRDAGLDRSLAS